MTDLLLCEKLDIKEGFTVKLINEPDNYSEMLNDVEKNISIVKKLSEPVDFIHLFTKSKKEFSVELPVLKNYLKQGGIFWVSWPIKSDRVISDLDGEFIKQIGNRNGFIVSKSCLLNKEWSALQFTHQNNCEEL